MQSKPNNLKTYLSKIDKYNKEELEEEYNKLYILLNTIFQEYRDREETIYLISRQLEEVHNRMVSNETQTF